MQRSRASSKGGRQSAGLRALHHARQVAVRPSVASQPHSHSSSSRGPGCTPAMACASAPPRGPAGAKAPAVPSRAPPSACGSAPGASAASRAAWDAVLKRAPEPARRSILWGLPLSWQPVPRRRPLRWPLVGASRRAAPPGAPAQCAAVARHAPGRCLCAVRCNGCTTLHAQCYPSSARHVMTRDRLAAFPKLPAVTGLPTGGAQGNPLVIIELAAPELRRTLKQRTALQNASPTATVARPACRAR